MSIRPTIAGAAMVFVFAAVVSTALPALAAKAIVKRGFIPGDVPDLPCTIQVDFTSAASGPDFDAFQPVHRYIVDTRDVDEADAWGWGKQGEFSLCLKVHDPAEAPKILAELQKLVPEQPTGSHGPVLVKRGTAWK